MPYTIHYDETSKVKSVSENSRQLTVKYAKAKGASGYTVYAIDKRTGREFTVVSTTTTAKFNKLPAGTYLVYVLPYVKNAGTDQGSFAIGKLGNVKEKKIK